MFFFKYRVQALAYPAQVALRNYAGLRPDIKSGLRFCRKQLQNTTQKEPILRQVLFSLSIEFRRWPTFAFRAIIGAEELNCRVRDGIGCDPFA